MARARRLQGPLRGRTYWTLIGLLACAGLRISEALHLKAEDVDLQEGVLTVRDSNYRKTRLVPVHASAVAPLQESLSSANGFFLWQRRSLPRNDASH